MNVIVLLCLSFLFLFLVPTFQQEVGYHSIQPPFGLPYWTLGGDAHLTENFVRLAEDRQSKRGSFWNNMPCDIVDWEATFYIRIHGVGKIGADGLAFWYTEEKSKISGSLLGAEEKFKGLGVLLDSYDNDNTGLHPYLAVVENDGTKEFIHDHEGKGGYQRGGCQIRARNLKEPTMIKIIYNKGKLSIVYALEGKGVPKVCVTDLDIHLSRGNYFGFSAATGELADHHDLHSFSVKSLDFDASLNEPLIPNIGKILSSIFNSNKMTSEAFFEQQKDLLARIDDLNASLKLITKDVGNQVKTLATGTSPPVVPLATQPRPERVVVPVPQPDKDCLAIMNTLSNLQKILDKTEKENIKKMSELKNEIRTSNTQLLEQTTSSTQSVLSWLNFCLLLLIVGFFIVRESLKMKEKSKKFF